MFLNECSRLPRAFCITSLVCTLLFSAASAAVPAPSRLDAAAAGFKSYMLSQIEESLVGSRALRDGIEAQDLAKAQAAWRAARGGWERSEVITSEYFPDLDDAIDAATFGQRAGAGE